jgi:molybdopterin-guanine dinucleotide biosynthesis protein A
MGRNKALLPYGDELLWQRQVRVLRDAGADPIALVLRPGQITLPGAPVVPIQVVHDLHRAAGPMAGLHAALTTLPRTDLACLLAVDLPRIEARWFQWLLRFCTRDVGAVAYHAAGYEPLAAIYPGAALPKIADQLARGEHSLQRLLEDLVTNGRMRPLPAPPGALDLLANWNEPGDVVPAQAAPGIPTFAP